MDARVLPPCPLLGLWACRSGRNRPRSLKPGWFDPTTFPLLRAYCCTVANAGFIAARLRELKPGDKGFSALLSLHARLSKQMALLAVRLRITPSSRSARGDPRDHRAGSGPRPWETG